MNYRVTIYDKSNRRKIYGRSEFVIESEAWNFFTSFENEGFPCMFENLSILKK